MSQISDLTELYRRDVESLYDFGTNSRAIGVLRREGLNPIGVLVQYTPDEIRRVGQIGPKTFPTIEHGLAQAGLGLKGTPFYRGLPFEVITGLPLSFLCLDRFNYREGSLIHAPLQERGITTMGDMITLSSLQLEELLGYTNSGPIKRNLQHFGLKLREESEQEIGDYMHDYFERHPELDPSEQKIATANFIEYLRRSLT